MHKIYIISGPTGAGKNTVALEAAKLIDRCAIVDFDVIRQMFIKPHHTPWDGSAGKHQNDLTIELVATLANRFVVDGFTTIILDVLSDDTAEKYRQLVKEPAQITQLLPAWEETLHRNQVRAKLEGRNRLTAEELKQVYADASKFKNYDFLIDNTDLSTLETAQKILRI